MTDEFRAVMDGLVEEYNRQAGQLREMYDKFSELEATAQSEDRMVTVTVGSRGQVRSIEFAPRVYRKLSPSELARSVVEQIGVATAEVAERTKELMTPFMPEDLPYEKIFGEGASFESFLPQPMEPPSGESR